MDTFIKIAVALLVIEGINYVCFLMRLYSSEAMILYNSIVLAIVSILCVVKITLFSNKFSDILKTIGDINQRSTASQIKRIRWITVTGNIFFCFRAFLEIAFACVLLYYYTQNGTVDAVLTHKSWDMYILSRHLTELLILSLVRISLYLFRWYIIAHAFLFFFQDALHFTK